MQKIKVKYNEKCPILELKFYKNHNYETLVSMLDQDLLNKCYEKYDGVEHIIDQGILLITESSLSTLRFTDKFFNDSVFFFEHQVKDYMFIWSSLENDEVPFKEGHTYHQKYNLGFGDHLLTGGFDTNIVKQKPSKLYFYLENGICGNYDIRFHNGIELSFQINEKDGIVNNRAWLNKNRLTDKSIIPTYVLLHTFFRLGLRPSKNHEAYKLLRNVMKCVYKILKEEKQEDELN